MNVNPNKTYNSTVPNRVSVESSIPPILTVVSVPASVGVAALVINIVTHGAFFALIGAAIPPVALIIGALVILLILAVIIAHLLKQKEPELQVHVRELRKNDNFVNPEDMQDEIEQTITDMKANLENMREKFNAQ